MQKQYVPDHDQQQSRMEMSLLLGPVPAAIISTDADLGRRIIMGYKTGMLVAVAVFCSSATADETIVNQATKVKSALETLNNLAHDCEMHFQIEEAPAKKSEACKEYLNAQRTHVPFLEEECSSLSKWYESMRQIVLAGAHLMDPVEADQLVTLMQVVRGTCGPETLDKHQLMTKRLSGLE